MTYKEIQEAFCQKYGYRIETCWIADVKRELGLTTRIAYNRENKNKVKYPCPEKYRNKVRTIIEELSTK